jgi:16S rRNA processing protein RimM
MSTKFVCVGKFLGAHGVRGQVKIASFTEDPENLTAYGALSDATGERIYQIKLQGWNNTHFIANVEGVADRNAAEKLKGKELFVQRAKLPKPKSGQYYYSDLIGLKVVLDDGSAVGEVIDVKNFGAGDIIEVKLTSGKKELYSFNPQTVPKVDTAKGQLVLYPPVWLDDNSKDED